MDSKFTNAIKRGSAKLKAKQDKERKEKEAKALAEERERKRQRKQADRWVQEKLPAIIEKETAKGIRRFSFGGGYSEGTFYAEDYGFISGDIMARACEAVGLRTGSEFVRRNHDGDCGTLWGDHYSYYVIW